MNGTVNTVLGPIQAEQLGVVAVHEALLSVLPGAQFGYDVTIDRAEVFETLAASLTAFRAAGGGTVVDSTGMFHGRDLRLYETLSRATGVHIVASTGLGPEELLGGYFLTPQTNPPTPWPAERFAALFTAEVDDGMVVPRVERRAAAGLIATVATRTGATPTDQSLLRGAARAARSTGVAVSLRYGADAEAELGCILAEGLPAERVVVGGLDRTDAIRSGAPIAVARFGSFVGIDNVGRNDAEHITDRERVAIVAELVDAGHADRILLSSSSIGVAKGIQNDLVPLGHVLSSFVPALSAHGLDDVTIQRILLDNPRDLLTVR